MKAIMYHYVREDHVGLPYFKHLRVDDFRKQLDYFARTYGCTSKAQFAESLETNVPAPGVILTFDDGFSDHHRYVLPELLQRGLWGIFYISTGPLTSKKLIDVHRIHFLIGRHGGTVIADAIKMLITEEMISHGHVEEFRRDTYSRQKNSDNTRHVKRLLNYFIDYRYREKILDELMAVFCPEEDGLAEQFYMTPSELVTMRQSGMVIGSHTVTHPVMSKLSHERQADEIVTSFKTLELVTGASSYKTFCYPYGGFHSFTPETEALLEREKCGFSFNVEPRDISHADLERRRQALPRFDCNAFPYGSCRGED